MNAFRIGDRVRVTSERGDAHVVFQKEGTVVSVHEHYYYLVAFQSSDFKGSIGHDLYNYRHEPGERGWNISGKYLELAVPDTPFTISLKSYIRRELCG